MSARKVSAGMTTTRRALLLAAAAAAAVPAAAAQAAGPAGDQLQALFDETASDLLESLPETATLMGLDQGRYAAVKFKLNDRSATERARFVRVSAERRRRLKGIDRKAVPSNAIVEDERLAARWVFARTRGAVVERLRVDHSRSGRQRRNAVQADHVDGFVVAVSVAPVDVGRAPTVPGIYADVEIALPVEGEPERLLWEMQNTDRLGVADSALRESLDCAP